MPRASGRLTWIAALLLLLGAAGGVRAQDPPVEAKVAELMELARARWSGREVARLGEVVSFAREAHRGMTRDGGEPFLLHPLRVAGALLARPVPVAHHAVHAAILHDVVEDTRYTSEEVRRRFGERVARVVHEVTLDPLERFGGDKAARDRAYYERFRRASREAHLLKFYDRLDNVNDMRGWPAEGKLRYLAATRATVIAALRGRSPDLARALEVEVSRLEARYHAELRGEADPRRFDRFRRADGTLRWGEVLRERARAEGAGLIHFTLALFLKELAVVVQTGDRLRIEEFFDGLARTDFYLHYGAFSLGARAGQVVYARYLDRFVKPRFVSGLLKTNMALAMGLALPQLLDGSLDGRAFAVSLTSLGLSTTAVRTGCATIGWIKRLNGLRIARTLTAARRFSRLATFGGWVYTVAETVVVLYFADAIQERIATWLDRRAARKAVREAGEAFLDAAGAAPDADAVAEAAADYHEAWSRYRTFLYAPVLAAEVRLNERLSRMARRAKLLDDERGALHRRLDGLPALEHRLEERHLSAEGYLAARHAEDEAEIAADVAEAMAAYERERDERLVEVYGVPRRPTGYLDDAEHILWHGLGAPEGAATDPWRSRRDLAARLGRERARDAFGDLLEDPSPNRLETYADEAAVLDLAARALAARHGADDPRVATLHEAAEEVGRLGTFDRAVASSLHGDGITDVLTRGSR